jgi:hypothetical protein
MKKLEWSDSTSNLLVVSSVLLAMMPFLLGDQLIPIVTGLMREAAVTIEQFRSNLASLLF